MPSEQLALRLPEHLLALVRERGEPGPVVRAIVEQHFAALGGSTDGIAVTPHAEPLSITLHHPDWDEGIVLYDLALAERVAWQILDAVRLLRAHPR